MTKRFRITTIDGTTGGHSRIVTADEYKVSPEEDGFTAFFRDGETVHVVRTRHVHSIEVVEPEEQPLRLLANADGTGHLAGVLLYVELETKDGVQVGKFVDTEDASTGNEPVYRAVKPGTGSEELTGQRPGVILHQDNLEPFTPAAVAQRLQDTLRDVTKSDEQIGWRVTAVKPA